MENLITFANDNLSYKLLAIIILGGVYMTKFTAGVYIKDTYKVLFASILFSVIFYFIDGCGKECMQMYLFTYLFATSFYELIVKYIMNKIKIFNEKH